MSEKLSNVDMSYRKMYGQYFTPNYISRDMVSMIGKNKNASVLKPSAGNGVFLKELCLQDFKNVSAVELDSTLGNESEHNIVYEDFLK